MSRLTDAWDTLSYAFLGLLLFAVLCVLGVAGWLGVLLAHLSAAWGWGIVTTSVGVGFAATCAVAVVQLLAHIGRAWWGRP